MGTTLTGTTPQDTYDSLIKVTDNGPLSGTLKTLTDGLGNDSALALSTGAASITGSLTTTAKTLAERVQVGTAATLNDATGVGNTLQFANYSPSVFVTGSADSYIYKNSTVFGGLAAQSLVFQTRSDTTGGGFAFVAGGTPAVVATITSAGNVGIGTSSPQSTLDVRKLSTNLGTTSELGLLISNTGVLGQYAQIGFGYSESACAAVIGGVITSASGATNSALVFATRSSTVGSAAPTERMRITSAGVVELAQGQIKFPATQVASADANTLDDYEEGTWTATLTDGTVTKSVSAEYTKIGRQVFIRGGISNVEDPSAFTGSVYVTGVPFAPIGGTSMYGFNNYLQTASVFVPYLESNQVIRFYKVGAASADNAEMQGSDLDFYTDIYFAGTFNV